MWFIPATLSHADSEKGIPNSPNRSRTYDLPITSSDALPLSYRRHVEAVQETRGGSAGDSWGLYGGLVVALMETREGSTGDSWGLCWRLLEGLQGTREGSTGDSSGVYRGLVRALQGTRGGSTGDSCRVYRGLVRALQWTRGDSTGDSWGLYRWLVGFPFYFKILLCIKALQNIIFQLETQAIVPARADL